MFMVGDSINVNTYSRSSIDCGLSIHGEYFYYESFKLVIASNQDYSYNYSSSYHQSRHSLIIHREVLHSGIFGTSVFILFEKKSLILEN